MLRARPRQRIALELATSKRKFPIDIERSSHANDQRSMTLNKPQKSSVAPLVIENACNMSKRNRKNTSYLLLWSFFIVLALTCWCSPVQAFWWSSNKKDNSKEEVGATAKVVTDEKDIPQSTQNEQNIALTTENALHAAAHGLVDELKHHLTKQDVHQADENGWMPLHEAARAGHLEVVQTLLEHGANIDARTGARQDGGSVLYWAKTFLGPEHAVVAYLENLGALDVEPEL